MSKPAPLTGNASELARQVGITPEYAWYIMHGRRTPRPAIAARIAKYYGISLDTLYRLVWQRQKQAQAEVAAA